MLKFQDFKVMLFSLGKLSSVLMFRIFFRNLASLKYTFFQVYAHINRQVLSEKRGDSTNRFASPDVSSEGSAKMYALLTSCLVLTWNIPRIETCVVILVTDQARKYLSNCLPLALNIRFERNIVSWLLGYGSVNIQIIRTIIS